MLRPTRTIVTTSWIFTLGLWLPLSVAWAPRPFPISNHRYPTSRTVLSVKQSSTPAETESERNAFFFPWASQEKRMTDQVELMGKTARGKTIQADEEMEGMSPELLGGGAIAGLITVAVGLYAATNMDLRYVLFVQF